MGQNISRSASARFADENIRKDLADDAKPKIKNAQLYDEMVEQSSILGTYRIRAERHILNMQQICPRRLRPKRSTPCLPYII